MHTYIHTYTHTHIHTYITLHYITLHCITLHYITLHTYIHTLHTCMHAYIHPSIHPSIHTYIHTLHYLHTYRHIYIYVLYIYVSFVCIYMCLSLIYIYVLYIIHIYIWCPFMIFRAPSTFGTHHRPLVASHRWRDILHSLPRQQHMRMSFTSWWAFQICVNENVCMYVCMYVCSVALYHTSDRRLSLKNCHQKHLFKTLSHLWIIVKPCYTSVCWWSVHWWKKIPLPDWIGSVTASRGAESAELVGFS